MTGKLDPRTATGGQHTTTYATFIRLQAQRCPLMQAARRLDDPGVMAAALNGKYAGWGDFAAAVAANPSRVARIQAAGGLSERVPSEGGFAVPEELRSDMVLASLESAIIRPRATVVPASTLRTGLPVVDDPTHATASQFGGLTWAWTEEGAPIAQSDPSWARHVLTAKKVAAYLGATPNELLADAPAFEVWLKRWVPAGLAYFEDQAFIAGTGVGQPQGIINAPAAIAVTRANSSAVGFVDVVKMQNQIMPASLRNFIWLCSPDVLIQLLELYLTVGTTPTSAVASPPEWLKYSDVMDCWTLLGRPLYPTEHVSKLGTAGDLVAVDPSFYVIADRMLLQVAVAPDGKGFVSDESEIRFTARLDGRIWLNSPLTPQNSSETVSCVVVLH